MATWALTTFSTAVSLATHEGEINSLTATDWSSKITIAKTMMGNDIQEMLVNRGMDYWTDFESGEILLDTITNKDIFEIVSDFKTLDLCYQDLSNGEEDSVYGAKMTMYRQMYNSALRQAMKYVDLDINQDGTTDIYKAKLSAIGRNTR